MQKDTIKPIILEREAQLKLHKNQIQEIHESLTSSKFFRIINNIGYFIKRWTFLLFGVGAIVLAIGLFFFPGFFYGAEAKEDFVMKYRSDFYQNTGDVFEQAIPGKSSQASQVANYKNEFGLKLDSSLQETVALEMEVQFKIMALISLVLGLFSLYISSLTKSVFVRNEKLVAVEKVLKGTLKDYEQAIQSNQDLKEFLQIDATDDTLTQEV